MNQVIRETAKEILGDYDRIRIIEPLEVLDFHNFLSRTYLILTDNGGIQEEAPSLGKTCPCNKKYDRNARSDSCRTLKLVGTNEEVIYKTFKLLLKDTNEYEKMSHAGNPYGYGFASKRMADILEYGQTMLEAAAAKEAILKKN